MTLKLGAGDEPALSVFAGLHVTRRRRLRFLCETDLTPVYSRDGRGRKIVLSPAIFSTRISTRKTGGRPTSSERNPSLRKGDYDTYDPVGGGSRADGPIRNLRDSSLRRRATPFAHVSRGRLPTAASAAAAHSRSRGRAAPPLQPTHGSHVRRVDPTSRSGLVDRQESHRYDLRDMTPKLAVRFALRDGIFNALCCKLSRDSANDRRSARIHARAAPQADPRRPQSSSGPRCTATF